MSSGIDFFQLDGERFCESYIDEEEIELCDFEGTVTLNIEGIYLSWECPSCEYLHQEDYDPSDSYDDLYK